MSSINDKLPHEMLGKIFSFLDGESSSVCREVCSKWKSVVDETIGVTCAIGSNIELVTYNPVTGEEIYCPQIPLEGISTLGVKFCSIGPIENLNYGSNLHFGFPTCLKSLHFRGRLPQENFESLTLPLTSLTEFSVHYSALMNIDLKNSDTLLNQRFEFPVLKVFKVCSKRFNPDTDIIGIKLVMENVRHLLNSLQSRVLDKIFMDIPHYQANEIQTVGTIFDCIDRHWRTLRSLDMFFCVSINDTPVNNGGGDNLGQEENLFDWSNFKALFFKRICMACGKAMKTYEDWKMFMKIQRNLEEVYWMNEELRSCVTGTSVVSPNLRKILFQLNSIDSRPSIYPDFDCDVFASCSGLTHLLVRGRTGFNLREGHRIRAIVSNGHRLPSSIEVLSFREVYVPTNTISLIIKQCVKIRKFRLVDIGHTGNWGLGPSDFTEITRGHKYDEFEISNGFNKSAFRSWENSDIYHDAVFWMILHTGTLHAVKFEADEFFNTPYYAFKTASMFEYPPVPAIRPHAVCDVVFQ